jgi:m7GpppX diphosphatase
MKFKKIEILEIKNDTNTYYGTIDNVSAILISEKTINDEITLDSKVNLIYPASNEIIDSFRNKVKIITETYLDYKNKVDPYINSILETNTKWLKNILNLQTETEKILFKGEKFIVVKNIGYDSKNDFYLLAIPYEELRTIRDLRGKHKELLKLMKLKTLEIAKKRNFEENDLYFFFHYHPSCYHLHLHVCVSNHKNLKFRLYRHILLDYAIDHIEKLEKKTLKFEMSISNPIYKLLLN